MESYYLKSIGELSPHPDIPDEWLISEKVVIPFFNGRKIDITIDGYIGSNEDFFGEVDKAIQNFLSLKNTDRLEVSSLVFENYKEIYDEFKEYEDIPKIINEEDIWKYVYPHEIFVEKRHRRDRDVYIRISCECAWEVEHGLQLVFLQGIKITRVSSQDGHITEADARDKPDEEDELLSKF